jgi:hypothetical protein
VRQWAKLLHSESAKRVSISRAAHVAGEHAWAMAAKAGNPEKLGYFYAMGEAEENEGADSPGRIQRRVQDRSPGNRSSV